MNEKIMGIDRRCFKGGKMGCKNTHIFAKVEEVVERPKS
jgi:hypothetical protein